MRLTNLFNLPDPIYQAVANDPYSPGDAAYSITGLIKPARVARLQKDHDHEIVEDIADRIFSLLGQAVHTILERSERIAIAEKRLYAELDGVRISGQTDRFVLLSGLLQDYKVTTLWKIKKQDYEEWEAQQNAYRYLLFCNGYDVKKLEIVAFLRDWSKRKARTEESYPVAQVAVVDLPIWPMEKTIAMLRTRIEAHEKAKVELPLCTREERWMDSDSFAVIRPGNKRATAVRATLEEAQQVVSAAGGGLEIKQRRGEPKRCLDYCSAARFCDQFKSGQC